MGVTEQSVVRTIPELREQLRLQLERYQQPILVERFIQGREVLVGMVGNPTPNGDVTDGLTFVPILEVDFKAFGEDHVGFYTSEMKTVLSPDNYYYHCPAPLTDEQASAIRQMNRPAPFAARLPAPSAPSTAGMSPAWIFGWMPPAITSRSFWRSIRCRDSAPITVTYVYRLWRWAGSMSIWSARSSRRRSNAAG